MSGHEVTVDSAAGRPGVVEQWLRASECTQVVRYHWTEALDQAGQLATAAVAAAAADRAPAGQLQPAVQALLERIRGVAS